MAQWRKRPKQCQHGTCQSGECGKCAYNPRSGYPMFHVMKGTTGWTYSELFSLWPYVLGVVVVLYLLIP